MLPSSCKHRCKEFDETFAMVETSRFLRFPLHLRTSLSDLQHLDFKVHSHRKHQFSSPRFFLPSPIFFGGRGNSWRRSFHLISPPKAFGIPPWKYSSIELRSRVYAMNIHKILVRTMRLPKYFFSHIQMSMTELRNYLIEELRFHI